jgi:hypothetical protein
MLEQVAAVEPSPVPRCPPHMRDGLPWALTSTFLLGCARATTPSALLERTPGPPRAEVTAAALAPSGLPKPPPAAARPELEAVRTASVACHRSLGKYCADNHCPATLDEAIARMACRAPPILDCGPYRTITWSDGRSYFKGFYDARGVLVGALAGSDSIDPRCGTLVHYGISVSCQERARALHARHSLRWQPGKPARRQIARSRATASSLSDSGDAPRPTTAAMTGGSA